MMLCLMLMACATSYAWFVRSQIRGAFNERIDLQMRSAAYMIAKEALRGLRRDTSGYDSLLEDWFKPMFVPVEGLGVANILFVPLDDKLPLQNLFLPDGVTLRNEMKKPWENLWKALGDRKPEEITLDFIDSDKKGRVGGGEKDNYANRKLVDISELLGLDEITPELLYGSGDRLGLSDYCTMWCSRKMNINVTSAAVLALIDGIDASLAKSIVEYRNKNELRKLDDLKEIPGFPEKAIPTLMNLVGFSSSYFNLKIELISNEGTTRHYDIVLQKSAGRVVRWEEM